MLESLTNLVQGGDDSTGSEAQFECVDCGATYDHPAPPCEECGGEAMKVID